VEESSFRLRAAPPALTAEGLHLRTFSRSDAGLLVRASGDAEIVRWTFIPPNLDEAGAIALAERWLSRAADGQLRQYVISAQSSQPPVGMVSLVLQDPDDDRLADIAYWLLPEGRGRGLVSGSVRLVLQWAIEQSEVRRVALYTKEGNQRSERVAQRGGFSYTGTVRRQRGERVLWVRRWLFEPDRHGRSERERHLARLQGEVQGELKDRGRP
jgi:[ribosomal protein S5]-alanine N-acetyltransferase